MARSLFYCLSDAFTERALREIAEDYIRLGIITDKDLTADAVVPVQNPENVHTVDGFGL